MKYSIRDIFEYIIALINEFAKRYSLTKSKRTDISVPIKALPS